MTAAGAGSRPGRQRALYHVLALIAGSSWADGLVLRGSVLLPAWFGSQARPPGDLDWVVRPDTRTMVEQSTEDMLAGIIEAIRRDPVVDATTVLDPDRAQLENIWTYDRAPGRRIYVPWRGVGEPGGYVGVDFVFEEPLPESPQWMMVPTGDGRPDVGVWAASPELSLAWKLLWLSTDQFPQGKDLYDATLLAEYTTVPLPLLREVLAREWGAEAADFTPDTVLEWTVDWNTLQRQYPWITGADWEWSNRLADALVRTFH